MSINYYSFRILRDWEGKRCVCQIWNVLIAIGFCSVTLHPLPFLLSTSHTLHILYASIIQAHHFYVYIRQPDLPLSITSQHKTHNRTICFAVYSCFSSFSFLLLLLLLIWWLLINLFVWSHIVMHVLWTTAEVRIGCLLTNIGLKWRQPQKFQGAIFAEL